MSTAATRCGFVALIGAPNAGKSTLINQAVGTKVSIVSRKVQTTRALVRGIALDGCAQIIFVDTPGIFAPKRRLDRAMVASAWSGASDADAIALLVDARKGVDDETAAILAALSLPSLWVAIDGGEKSHTTHPTLESRHHCDCWINSTLHHHILTHIHHGRQRISCQRVDRTSQGLRAAGS